MTSAPGSSQGAAKEEEVLMPETSVSGEAVARRHPQDALWSQRPLGCVEVVVPSDGGAPAGAYYQASRAKEGIPVIPSLNDPSSANGRAATLAGWAAGGDYYQHPATPAGQEGKPGCAN
jgi:hypothetical protein